MLIANRVSRRFEARKREPRQRLNATEPQESDADRTNYRRELEFARQTNGRQLRPSVNIETALIFRAVMYYSIKQDFIRVRVWVHAQ